MIKSYSRIISYYIRMKSTEITVYEHASYGTGHGFLVISCLMMLITITANYILFSIAGFHTTSPKFKLQNY